MSESDDVSSYGYWKPKLRSTTFCAPPSVPSARSTAVGRLLVMVQGIPAPSCCEAGGTPQASTRRS